ncbi:hypothetical protein DFQ11_106150 [Winogradskyella epiphytica]|uniref:Peptidylprolyl isomerase n=1 Tax=Winogradskyella epiphytica TaxID=262005 RepID=A0A2V4WV55_9FLAO|nr:hypothetical protein [Winogradskyella epiphytica]PYE80347.1 hypothetical protein DFQ11_106150 [Winogradskyella epiphytica]GGW70698.1 hypothetical protein GCM10008085_23480 [Winogradskyella epiphytica]
MKLKFLRLSLLLLAVFSVVISCKDDDDFEEIPYVLEDRTEQQAKDKDSLLSYLSTHYYNSAFFETGTNHRYNDIVITELPKDESGNYLEMPDPENNTLLIEAVETLTTEYKDVSYEYYVLNINQGGGESPNFTDKVRVRYQGVSVGNQTVFDAVSSPITLPLVGDGFQTGGAIRAWQLVIPTFKTAVSYSYNDGVVEYDDFGLGMMFVPSGLAYFAGVNTGSAYDNLIFKFELLQYEVVDHDSDGIPSWVEDLDGDLDVSNDDTDGNGFPNYVDRDDDGDGVLTRDELIPTTYTIDLNAGEEEPVLSEGEFEVSRDLNNGILTIETVTIADSNNDGLADYLDPNITINYNE